MGLLLFVPLIVHLIMTVVRPVVHPEPPEGEIGSENFNSALGDWRGQWTTNDMGVIDYFVQDATDPAEGAGCCLNTTAEADGQILIHNDIFSSHGQWYAYGWVKVEDTSGSFRLGVTFGGDYTGSSVDSGIFIYLLENTDLVLAHWTTGGGRTADAWDTQTIPIDTWYWMEIQGGTPSGGVQNIEVWLYDNEAHDTLMANVDYDYTVASTMPGSDLSPTVWEFGLAVTNSGGGDGNWDDWHWGEGALP